MHDKNQNANPHEITLLSDKFKGPSEKVNNLSMPKN